MRNRQWTLGTGDANVFARAKKKVETDDQDFGRRGCQRGGFQLGERPNLSNDGKGKGLDPGGRRIILAPGLIQRGKPEVHVAVRV